MPRRTYYCVALLQGWSGSPGLFHSRISSNSVNKPCVYYIDFIIEGCTFEGHNRNIDQVLNILNQMGLKLNSEKKIVGVREIPFFEMDFIESSINVESCNQKQKGVLPVSDSVRDIKKLIGIFNLTRNFCPHLSFRLSPLQFSWVLRREYLLMSWKLSLPQFRKNHQHQLEFVLLS